MAERVRYSINLKKAFDSAFASKTRDVKAALRPLLKKSDLKRQIGRKVIEEIKKRTQEKSVDRNGRPFPKYSESYKKSLAYQVYGKSSKVNLTLSGEMMASMVAKTDSPLTIDIVMADQANNDKAHGNITGSYGRPSGNSAKARDFLGLPDEDLQKIVREEVNRYSRSSTAFDLEALVESFATSQLARTTTGTEAIDFLIEGFEDF